MAKYVEFLHEHLVEGFTSNEWLMVAHNFDMITIQLLLRDMPEAWDLITNSARATFEASIRGLERRGVI